jgi:hypothetical protein
MRIHWELFGEIGVREKYDSRVAETQCERSSFDVMRDDHLGLQLADEPAKLEQHSTVEYDLAEARA